VDLDVEKLGPGPGAIDDAFTQLGVADVESAYALSHLPDPRALKEMLDFFYWACELASPRSELKARRNLLLSPFQTGFGFGSCAEPRCRWATLEQSLKRALLLSGNVVLKNPFAKFFGQDSLSDGEFVRHDIGTLLVHL